jgi:hypothetical protein
MCVDTHMEIDCLTYVVSMVSRYSIICDIIEIATAVLPELPVFRLRSTYVLESISLTVSGLKL